MTYACWKYTRQKPLPVWNCTLLCWGIENTASGTSKLLSYILHHSRSEKGHEHYVNYKPFLRSQGQDCFFQGHGLLVIHIGSSFKFKVTPSRFIIYSIVLPNTGCSVFITTSCNCFYSQRSLTFSLLGPVPVIEHAVRTISFFSLSLKLLCHEFDSVREILFSRNRETRHYLFSSNSRELLFQCNQ